ncbi:MAG TPA: DNA recombination protein RmuC [Burkholderiales bacterium]|jgi:DNA recombination protein RmuC|nr:DNA recombination protein RmuC [Burkholderiales bacterium]
MEIGLGIGLWFVTSVAAGAVLGALGMWLWHRGTAERLEDLKGVEKQLVTEQALVATLQERVRRIPELEQELEGYQAVREENARLLQALTLERRQADEKLKLLAEAKEALAEQFQNLANRIFEEKGEKLVQQNVANLDSLLRPLGERLKEFQVRVEETYDKESKQRFSLQNEIQKLVEANARMSVDTLNLTNALKGDSRTQGAWGEVVLERVLEASGLQRGREYDLQVSLEGAEGSKARPDVIIRLPENKHVVVDAKVSLTAYEAYTRAEDDAGARRELARHVDSLRAHVKGLAEKNYQSLYGIRTPDFVLMFVPVEPAFVLALRERQELFEDAFNRNVMIVSPTTLLISLRTIASIWRYEYQNRNAQELVRQCTALYDKFVGFVADLEDIGRRLKAAQSSYDDAYGKLASGKGNLIRQVERIRELGLKPSKPLPGHLTELAVESESAAPQ